MQKSNVNSSRMIIGVLLVLFGGMFLMENFGLFNFTIPWWIRENIFSWETILIFIGIMLLSYTHHKRGAVVLISIGVLGFLPELWPLLLIGLGLFILLRRRRIFPEHKRDFNFNDNTYNSEDFFRESAIFGGGSKKMHSFNFKGGNITAVFGGYEVDLRDCQLAEGEHVLEIFAVFGGATIIVPHDWDVVTDVVPVLGGFSDKRFRDPQFVASPERKLIIKGVVIFGGGEVKN